MTNKERKQALNFDTPNRCREFTHIVFSGKADNPSDKVAQITAAERKFDPPPSEYNIYFGDIHGHSNLSDGNPDPDAYFINMRDNAKLDFCALTDHDHGGVGHDELFGKKWELLKEYTDKYNLPNKFTTLFAYERDSYPWYGNLVVYFKDSDGMPIRGEVDGEITKKELENALKRDDVILVPHDTYYMEAGADLSKMPFELLTGLIEIYSRGDSAEYFNNPQNISPLSFDGGFWQDALKRGAKMGCIAASDDHFCKNGIILDNDDSIYKFPGLTGVLAKENTREAIFDALQKRRCYAFMGGRIHIDFRINNHYMGEEFCCNADRAIYFNIDADAPVDKVTVVKNCQDKIIIRRTRQLFFDYSPENETDVYYLRVELKDGRCAWTSPIWVNNK